MPKSAGPTKAEIKKLEKSLLAKPTLVWDGLSPDDRQGTLKLAEDYKSFLHGAKTEREAAAEIIRRAAAAGFRPFGEAQTNGRLIFTHMGKVVGLAALGTLPPSAGLRMIISHIDAPRLDLKPRPLYEDVDLAFLKTHYYGGLKKYQWLSRPLALHGFVVKDDGRRIELVIGEDEADPVLTIADLLPHLARKVQADKKVNEAFPGEKLNLLVGSLPLGDDQVKNRFKLAVIELLNRRWGLIEEDFISAEFEAVPAGRPRDVGLDGSLIGGYGQDDRICAFASLNALLTAAPPARTTVALFVDKEEIGSDGATSAQTRFIEDLTAGLLEARGLNPTSTMVRRTLMTSRAISADVEAALDPDYQEVHEKNNAARLGYGPCLARYGGSGGKYGSSEASAEYMGWLRGIFNREGILWQSATLGKVDEGGGGTVAVFLAKYAMEVVDGGPPILAMHSPFEISSKADLWMTCKAYRTFYQAE